MVLRICLSVPSPLIIIRPPKTLDRAGSLHSSLGLLRAPNPTAGSEAIGQPTSVGQRPNSLLSSTPSFPLPDGPFQTQQGLSSRQSLMGGQPLIAPSSWMDSAVAGGSGVLQHHYMDRFYGPGETPPMTPSRCNEDVLQGSNMDALFASLEERAGFEQRLEDLENECDRLRTQVGCSCTCDHASYSHI